MKEQSYDKTRHYSDKAIFGKDMSVFVNDKLVFSEKNVTARYWNTGFVESILWAHLVDQSFLHA